MQPEATTYEKSQRGYSWPEAATNYCGKRPQHLKINKTSWLRYQCSVTFKLLWPLATTNCDVFWLQIISLRLLICCGLWLHDIFRWLKISYFKMPRREMVSLFIKIPIWLMLSVALLTDFQPLFCQEKSTFGRPKHRPKQLLDAQGSLVILEGHSCTFDGLWLPKSCFLLTEKEEDCRLLQWNR